MSALLMLVVVGVLVLAIIVDLAALLGWLRRQIGGGGNAE